MRILILLFAIALFAGSCSKDEKMEPDANTQKWVLVKMSGMAPNSETMGGDMEWQEYYLLYSDGTFMKQREREGIQVNARGNFTFTDKTQGKYLELIYDANSEIIGSCNGNNTETLWVVADDKLSGTWLACDGPGLEYEKVD